MASKDQARELATRLAGAAHSRRLYLAGSPIWRKTLDGLSQELSSWFQAHAGPEPLTFALLGDGMAVGGVPIVSPPAPLVRFVQQLKARDVEIIALKRETGLAELETLLTFLSADAAEVSGVKGTAWLK